jgi:hypothetical protein
MVYLRNGLMFLVPPCEMSRKYFDSKRNYMLGVFVDQKAAAEQ